MGEGNYKSIAVSVGRYGRNNVEILDGLNEGDIVVSSAQFLLDSESSKTSDFKRLHYQYEFDEPAEMEVTENNFRSSPPEVSSATVNGTVVSAMLDHRMVTIDREAIEHWGREADRVDFIVADNVDMTLFSIGAYVMFTFEIRAGNFIIVSAMPMTNENANKDEGE